MWTKLYKALQAVVSKDFGFYSECNERSLKGLEQRRDMTGQVFKGWSDCCV